jgi:uncharacterized protein YigE (DUF2233 family)
MLSRRLTGLFALFLCLTAIGGCRLQSPTSSVDGVAVQKISFNGEKFTVVEINLQRANLQLFWKRSNGSRFGNFDAIKSYLHQSSQHLIFAANAGMYNTNFDPCGLEVEGGLELAPLNLNDGHGNFYLKPNGVFFVTDGQARIVDSTQYPGTTDNMRLATQSGPLLVSAGKINPQFKPASDSRKIRSGVGVAAGDKVIFAISDGPVTLNEFALLFRDRLNCPNALFLDGTISKFYIPDETKDAGENFSGILAVTAPDENK